MHRDDRQAIGVFGWDLAREMPVAWWKRVNVLIVNISSTHVQVDWSAPNGSSLGCFPADFRNKKVATTGRRICLRAGLFTDDDPAFA